VARAWARRAEESGDFRRAPAFAEIIEARLALGETPLGFREGGLFRGGFEGEQGGSLRHGVSTLNRTFQEDASDGGGDVKVIGFDVALERRVGWARAALGQSQEQTGQDEEGLGGPLPARIPRSGPTTIGRQRVHALVIPRSVGTVQNGTATCARRA
jgi:hypothetical protein